MTTSLKIRLLATSLLGACAVTPAVAQTPATAPAPEVDATEATIVVTGSRIARADLEQASPVAVIGEEDLQISQPTSVEQFLRELPGTAPGIGQQVNNGANGTASFNLRGLGTNRNLVLLNGRRVIPSTLGNVVDLNVIPVAMIERAEVFTGGASSVYGADAVSGVVNFITKQNFSGVDISANYGITERGDGATRRLDLTIGGNFADDRGNVVLGLSHTNAKPVLQGDRAIGTFARASTCTAAENAAGTCAAALVGARQGSNTATPASIFFPLPAAGVFAAGAQFTNTGDIAPGLSDYNFNPLNLFQTPLNRYSVFGQARYDITPAITVYSEAMFARSYVRQELAPTGTFTNSFRIPLNNQFLTPASRLQLCDWAIQANNLPAGTNCPAAITAGTEITAIVARRFSETGPRVAEFTSNVFQFTVGVRGKITDTLNFDISGQYGEANRRNTATGTALQSRVQAALRGCPSGSAAGCVPINIFGGEGSLTPQMLAFVGVPTNTFIDTRFETVQATISGDFGVSSPFSDSPIGVAVGVEYRKYAGGQFGDLPSATSGEILGSGGAFTTIKGSYFSKEAFAEVNIPVVTDVPGFHNLTVEAGARYADYNLSGGNWTYKVGGSWAPIPDIKFRGVYSRAVRAPNLSELFAPQNTVLNNLATDPCQLALPVGNAATTAICTAQLAAVGLPASRIGSIPAPIAGQINVTGGGNPNLRPEIATTFTAGIVLQPKSVIPGLTATADWYRIRVSGAISSPTVSDILNGCFGQTSPTDSRCQAILRNPLTGGLSGNPADTRGVLLVSSNLGYIESEGFDFSLGYRRDFGDASLALAFNGNYTTKSRFQSAPTSFIRECVNFYSASCDPVLPKFSFNTRATVGIGPGDISLIWRHINSVSYEPRTGASATTPPVAGTVGSFGSTNPATIVGVYRTIPAYNYFDLSLRAEIMNNLKIGLLVENLFDRSPPDVGNTIGSTGYNSGNTFPSTYDTLGRRFTMSASLRF